MIAQPGFIYTQVSYHNGKLYNIILKSQQYTIVSLLTVIPVQPYEWVKLFSSFDTRSFNTKKSKYDLSYSELPASQTDLALILKPQQRFSAVFYITNCNCYFELFDIHQ